MKAVESFKRFIKSIWIILFLIIILVVVGYFVFYPNFVKAMQPASFGSSNTYRLSIGTDGQLFNVTFIIPLPVRNGIPAVGILNLTESMFEKGGYRASFIQLGGDQFLRLTEDTVLPNIEYEVTYGDNNLRTEYSKLGYIVEYENAKDYPYWINTRQPAENETIFLPKNNITRQEPATPTYSTGSGIRFNPVLLRYQTNIYAEFDTASETLVRIFASTEGQNSWVEEFGASRGNSYSDYYQESFSGPARGWHLANGELKSGEGKYLNGTY
jgi:hypothetical protein